MSDVLIGGEAEGYQGCSPSCAANAFQRLFFFFAAFNKLSILGSMMQKLLWVEVRKKFFHIYTTDQVFYTENCREKVKTHFSFPVSSF